MKTPTPDVIDRISRLVGGEATSFECVQRGYTPAARWTFEAGGNCYFAKMGTTEGTCGRLRREIEAYDRLSGDFMPERIAAEDHESAPLLILEDLSARYWPPPWRAGDVEAVISAIRKLHGAVADLPTYEERYGPEDLSWPLVAADSGPFLSLAMVSKEWLEFALPRLLDAEAECVTQGEAVIHCDIRSDNICLDGASATLIDWDYACLGSANFDMGFWLPSLAYEGGPTPEALIGDEPEIAAFVSGYLAARAGTPIIENAPRVREVQRQQLGPALAWAARALDLPPPDAA